MIENIKENSGSEIPLEAEKLYENLKTFTTEFVPFRRTIEKKLDYAK